MVFNIFGIQMMIKQITLKLFFLNYFLDWFIFWWFLFPCLRLDQIVIIHIIIIIIIIYNILVLVKQTRSNIKLCLIEIWIFCISPQNLTLGQFFTCIPHTSRGQVPLVVTRILRNGSFFENFASLWRCWWI